MPRNPNAASCVASIGGAVYSSVAGRIANHTGETYPLHVGDTWLEPAEGCRMQDLRADAHPGMHRYAHPRGMPALIDALVERVRARSGTPTERDNLLVTGGATGGLHAVMGAILDPGDEVLILAPYWPLITGIVRCCRAEPVAVPFIGCVDSPGTAVEQVRRFLSPRTTALYLSTPNNPTGAVLERDWLEALVQWARREELWIVADDVYEDYLYEGEHTYCRALAPERTFAAHSFSKAFGMAGNRCGYVVGPSGAMREACKVGTHTIYSTPTASQIAACRALDGRGEVWVENARALYRAAGAATASCLGVDPPRGSTFLFLDVASRLDDRGLGGLLEDCADHGLLLAPGSSFGPYPDHVRLCFTSCPPETVQRGVERLREILGSRGGRV